MKSLRFFLIATAAAAAPLSALAQDASWNLPYGATSSQNAGWNNAHRDANGNLEIVNGVMRTGAGAGSTLSQTGAFNGGVGGGGYGLASATAVGNQLNVVTSGRYNTVIVNSTQTNNGDVVAGANTTVNAKGQTNDQQ